MKIIFAIFAIAFAAWLVLRDDDAPVQGPPLGSIAAQNTELHALPPPGGPDINTGPALLRAAIERLDQCSSVTAMLRFQINLFDNQLIGSGTYQQAGQGSGRRLRFELKTQLGDRAASQVEICDGAFLWSYRQVGPESRLTRLDLKRVRDAQVQAAGASLSSPIPELAIGGVPKLLDQLLGSFQPLSAEAGHLGDTPAWAIQAEWKPAILAAIAQSQKDQTAAGGAFDFGKLPQLPQQVTIFLGYDDLFPRRIEFRRRDDAAGQGRGGEYAPVVTLEFTDVEFNLPIDPRQFDYHPGVAVEDVTEKFLQSRGLAPLN